LEPGYALAETNSLKELNYEITNNNNIDTDIIEFNLLLNDDENITNNSLSLYKCEHFESKTSKELFNIKFNKNVSEIDQEKELLSNKLIKANLFKNIINEYELINYSNVIYNYYDNIFLFILSKKNATFKHINKCCLIQYSTNIEYLNNEIHQDKNQTIKDMIFYINFLFDKSNNNTEDKKKVLNEFNNILSVIYNKNQKISKESQELYEKFINCEAISQPDKNLLNFYYQSLLT
jgi:hypothetical protein